MTINLDGTKAIFVVIGAAGILPVAENAAALKPPPSIWLLFNRGPSTNQPVGVVLNQVSASIVRIQQGETEAYATIIEHFQDMAVGYAYAALGDLAAAEDVAQEAFIAENMTVAYRLAMMRVPSYDPTLDLIVVAPDGQWVAFCMAALFYFGTLEDRCRIVTLHPEGTRGFLPRRVCFLSVEQILRLIKPRSE